MIRHGERAAGGRIVARRSNRTEAFPLVNRQDFQGVVIARGDSICRVPAAGFHMRACAQVGPRHRRFTTQGRAIAADHPLRPTS